jgi:hypothetical protein
VADDILSERLSEEQERALHRALLEGSRVASSELAEAYLDYLTQTLWRHYRARYEGLTLDDCATAAGDALVALIHHPQRYDPERGRLARYLLMSAAGDLRNAQKSAQRRRQRLRMVDPQEDDVVERLAAGNQEREDMLDPAELLARREAEQEARDHGGLVREMLGRDVSADEAEALELWLRGERRTEAFAAALGCTHLPLPEQRRLVKRWKDKLMKRWQRRRQHE